jgi:hypothetical protein
MAPVVHSLVMSDGRLWGLGAAAVRYASKGERCACCDRKQRHTQTIGYYPLVGWACNVCSRAVHDEFMGEVETHIGAADDGGGEGSDTWTEQSCTQQSLTLW